MTARNEKNDRLRHRYASMKRKQTLNFHVQDCLDFAVFLLAEQSLAAVKGLAVTGGNGQSAKVASLASCLMRLRQVVKGDAIGRARPEPRRRTRLTVTAPLSLPGAVEGQE